MTKVEVIATYYLECINSNLLLVKSYLIEYEDPQFYEYNSVLFTYMNDTLLSTDIIFDYDYNLSIKHAFDNNSVLVKKIVDLDTKKFIKIIVTISKLGWISERHLTLRECKKQIGTGKLYEFAINNKDLFEGEGPPILK